MERLAEVSGKSVIAGASRFAAGRSTALKLAGGQTRDRIMLFEETAPAGTDTTFHLHHDSDEVAYVLSGEISVETGNEFSVGGPGTCAFLPGSVPCAGKTLPLALATRCSSTLRLAPAGFSRNSWGGRPDRSVEAL
jgi:uncharacterized RmlC-like cupin family protein